MRILLAAALLAGTAATPAFAQDAPINTAATGPRVEALLGYDMPEDIDNGLLYGVGVGYDFALGNAQAGVEAEWTDTNSDSCRRNVDIQGDRLCSGPGRDLYVGGRLGIASFGGSALYVKGGYTNQRLRLDYNSNVTNGAGSFNIGENLDGVRVGAGVELGIPTFGLGSAAFLKGEYRYSNYEQGYEKHQAVAGVGFRF